MKHKHAYQMRRKMTCIDNHKESLKIRTDVEFSQSQSRSQEHQLPATQIVNIIRTIKRTQMCVPSISLEKYNEKEASDTIKMI